MHQVWALEAQIRNLDEALNTNRELIISQVFLSLLLSTVFLFLRLLTELDRLLLEISFNWVEINWLSKPNIKLGLVQALFD
jgi:hypothetical protein